VIERIWLPIDVLESLWLYLVLLLRYWMSKNVVTLKSGPEVTKGHWKWYHSEGCVRIPISILVTLSLCNFLRYSTSKISWPWNQGQKSLEVIGTDTCRSDTYDFLLTCHSNHESISYRFRDGRRIHSKIAKKIPTSVYFTPQLTGFPLELDTSAGGRKNYT